jgi:TonB family protein
VLLWMLAFYCALLTQHFLPALKEMAIPIGLVVALLAVIAASVAFRMAVALTAPLFGRAVETPPPPVFAGEVAQAVYRRPPRIVFPAAAEARGQCGWVVLWLRVDPTGRIASYAVIGQAPGRIFERAVARSLVRARVEPPEGATGPTVVISVVKFISLRVGAPAWARTAEGQAT